MFEFLDYTWNPADFSATFRYKNHDFTFSERVEFARTDRLYNSKALDRALFLAFILIGTSYYKTFPSREVKLNTPLDTFQAEFFSTVFQEGLSQFAYENGLTRKDLAEFHATENYAAKEPVFYDGSGILALQSGGKDSLLTTTLLSENAEKTGPWSGFYIGSSSNHPKILDAFNLQTAIRKIDAENLRLAAENGAKNGHVPVTYIVLSLALVQAILNGQNQVIASIGQEGNEPHSYIGDLAVNHQWSKTETAEKLFQKYVKTYISENLVVKSLLRDFSELKIAQLFAEKCWQKYGHEFSSCNVANYRQKANNGELKWCGHCAKCANSYLLFAPFIDSTEQTKLFDGVDLFTRKDLFPEFKGLLGIDGAKKPFECVGEVAELRAAYHHKLPGYADLPFSVPPSDFKI